MITCAVILALCIFSLRTAGSIQGLSWQLITSYLSFSALIFCFLTYCYVQWFMNPAKTVTSKIKKTVFFIYCLIMSAVIIGLGYVIIGHS